MENMHKGIGPDMLARLCNALNAKPFEFYWEDSILDSFCSTQDIEAQRIYEIFRKLDPEHRRRLLKDAEDYLLLLAHSKLADAGNDHE